MILDATTKKLEILLGGAITTNQLTFQCEWIDVTTTASTPGTNGGLTSGATPVDLVPVPGASTQRIVNGINIYNADTVAQTVTVRFNDNATLRTLKVAALAVGYTLTWSLAEGWLITDGSGRVQNSVPGRYLRTRTFNSGTSFTTSADVGSIKVRLRAPGGGGGNCVTAVTNSAAGGGGAQGGYAEKTFATGPSATVNYVVPAGGASATAGADATVTFGGVTVTAKGGPAGAAQTVAAPPLVSLGGAAPATSTNGDVNGAGAPGGWGNCETAAIAMSGQGGGEGGGVGRTTQGVGNAATGFGAGGGGGCILSGGANVAGGAGSAALLIVDEYA